MKVKVQISIEHDEYDDEGGVSDDSGAAGSLTLGPNPPPILNGFLPGATFQA
jgi:hypothetical protein